MTDITVPPEEIEFEKALKERDYYSDMADKLAYAIAKMTGEDIGEHSNMNDPHANALEAAAAVRQASEPDRLIADIRSIMDGDMLMYSKLANIRKRLAGEVAE